MRKWEGWLWVTFVVVGGVLISIVAYLAIKYTALSIAHYYLTLLLTISLSLLLTTYCLKSSHDIHIHHYFVGLIFLPLIGY
jgi:branched-subunit amino acid transport protein AzlD